MASEVYLTRRKESPKMSTTDIVSLIKRSKVEEKRQRRNTMLYAAIAASVLAVSGLIISL